MFSTVFNILVFINMKSVFQSLSDLFFILHLLLGGFSHKTARINLFTYFVSTVFPDATQETQQDNVIRQRQEVNSDAISRPLRSFEGCCSPFLGISASV